MNKFQPQLQFVVQNSDIANVMVQRHKERINSDLADLRRRIKSGQDELDRLNKEWHAQAKEVWSVKCRAPIAKALSGLKSLFVIKFDVRYGKKKESNSYRQRDTEVCPVLAESLDICTNYTNEYVRSISDLQRITEKDCRPFPRLNCVEVPVHYFSEQSFSRVEYLSEILPMRKGVYSFDFTPELQEKWDELAEKTLAQFNLYRQRNELMVELNGLPEFEKQVQARLTAQAMANMGGMPMLAALDASLSRPLLTDGAE